MFWVKKFIDGSNKTQAYSFAPISDFSSEMINNTREENKPLKTDLNHDINDNLMKRITKLEDMNDEIVKLLKNKSDEIDSGRENLVNMMLSKLTQDTTH